LEDDILKRRMRTIRGAMIEDDDQRDDDDEG